MRAELDVKVRCNRHIWRIIQKSIRPDFALINTVIMVLVASKINECRLTSIYIEFVIYIDDILELSVMLS